MFSLKLEDDRGNIVDINDGINYVVLGCGGLNPPSASLFTAKSPNRKGVKHNGSTLDERNISITIKILGNIEANRNALYAWVDTEQYVKVHYRNGLKNVYCEGYVEDCDIDLFTDNEVIELAILCGNPYWKDLQAIAAEITAVIKQFTFPFAIAAEGVPFSTLRTDNTTSVFNSGAETGIVITAHCKDEIKNPLFYDGLDPTRQLKINYTFPAGWTIVINTEGSPKTCKAIAPDGKEINLMRYLGNSPTWFSLRRGNNIFGFRIDGDAADLEVKVSFRNHYLGV